jgi:predicted PurR-regulated permease PerM
LKKNRKETGPVAVCQLRSGHRHPFGALRQFVPLGTGEEEIYRQLREAIPVLDAAVGKLVRLSGGFGVQCRNPQAQKKLEEFLKTDLLPRLNTLMGGMGTSIKSIFGVLSNFALGVIISAYILGERRNFKRQLILILRAAFSERTANWILKEASFANQKFNGFLIGKIVDSTIIGVLCFIFLALTGMPYTILISIIVGVTNMIPVFGPFIGAIPCIFILLIIDPFKSLEFAIFILILQQIDGNIIGPYILGDAVGLPTLWVMFAIIAGGALFGISGMFVGVPVFSVLYDLTKERVQNNLAERKIDIDTK